MPKAPPKPCNIAGCRQFAVPGRGRCEKHQAADDKSRRRRADGRRGSASARGYDGTWRKVRLMKLRQNPICETEGCGQMASEVDHIVPMAQGGQRLDMENLQALCKPCHSRKTVTEDGGFGR